MKLLGQSPTEDEIRQMMDEADKDGDESIDFVEFCKLMNHQLEEQNKYDELEKVFMAFCKKGKSTLDFRDLRDVFVSLGTHVSTDDCKLLIELKDGDRDYKLDYSEFVGFFMTS